MSSRKLGRPISRRPLAGGKIDEFPHFEPAAASQLSADFNLTSDEHLQGTFSLGCPNQG